MTYAPLMLPDISARVYVLYPFIKLTTLHKIGKNMLFEGVIINRNNIIYLIVAFIKAVPPCCLFSLLDYKRENGLMLMIKMHS